MRRIPDLTQDDGWETVLDDKVYKICPTMEYVYLASTKFVDPESMGPDELIQAMRDTLSVGMARHHTEEEIAEFCRSASSAHAQRFLAGDLGEDDDPKEGAPTPTGGVAPGPSPE